MTAGKVVGILGRMSRQQVSSAVSMIFVVTLLVVGCGDNSFERAPGRHSSNQPDSGAKSTSAAAVSNTDTRHDAVASVNLPTLSTGFSRQREFDLTQHWDAAQDGWASESAAQEVTGQLKRLAVLAKSLQHGTAAATIREEVSNLVSTRFSCTPLRPSPLAEVHRSSQYVIRTANPPADDISNARSLPGSNRERDLANALHELLRVHGDVELRIASWKVIQIDVGTALADSTATINTQVRMELASGESRRVSQTAWWQCGWVKHDGPPRLQSIDVIGYEEVIPQKNHSLFADRTFAVFPSNDDNRDLARQLGHGLDHWSRHIERTHRMDVYARWGLAIGDVNGDGFEDIYLCQPGGLPNRLFLHSPDGTVVEQAAEAGIDLLDRTSSALFLDLDNDGDEDLTVATAAGVLCWQNDGQGKFELRNSLELPDNYAHSLAAADFDQDGDLDIYVCVEFAGAADASNQEFVYHDANDGGRNVLYRNDISGSNWAFTDVTRDVGLDANNRRHSLAAAWEDYDNDGDMDLYVANDYGQNCLYRNDEGHFTDVATKLGVEDYGSGMSVSWADVDRDGRMDLYVGNMFSSAGNRITRQRRFQPDVDETTRAIYRRFAKGNSLFWNRFPATFDEEANEATVALGRWAWTSLLADVNNDGWQDALVANGYVTGDDSDDL